jgi:hypothetical protein
MNVTPITEVNMNPSLKLLARCAVLTLLQAAAIFSQLGCDKENTAPALESQAPIENGPIAKDKMQHFVDIDLNDPDLTEADLQDLISARVSEQNPAANAYLRLSESVINSLKNTNWQGQDFDPQQPMASKSKYKLTFGPSLDSCQWEKSLNNLPISITWKCLVTKDENGVMELHVQSDSNKNPDKYYVVMDKLGILLQEFSDDPLALNRLIIFQK